MAGLGSVKFLIILPYLWLLTSLLYLSRSDGVSLPWPLEGRIQLWGLMVHDSPQTPYTLLLENLLTWFPLYTLAHLLFYVEPQRSLFHPFKLNPRYPSNSLIRKEMFRSLRGVAICTLYEVVVNSLHQQGSLPSSYTPDIFKLGPGGAASLLGHLLNVTVTYMWADAHFYWSHRLLHSPWLYRRIHKDHHESYNPDPFSGLSMHWVESSIYFSSSLLVAPLLPLWAFRILTKGLLIFPLPGHAGYGTWSKETSVNHYLHHAKFNWNYGSSPLWDHIMGTNYPGDTQQDTARGKQARDQALLVGCSLGEGKEE